MESQPRRPTSLEEIMTEPKKEALSRRSILKLGALSLASATTLSALDTLAFVPKRLAQAAPTTLPDIQFDIGNFIAPVQTINNIPFQFGPVFTLFVTARLRRTPTLRDQQVLANALNTIERFYSFSPKGVFTFVAYGLPYFNRLPQSLIAQHMPRLLSDKTRFALEEAVPSVTDVSAQNPKITKKTFNVPVKIETNDMLFTFRSDRLINLCEVLAWLEGSSILNNRFVFSPRFNRLLKFTSSRLMFVQPGLPRRVANAARLSYRDEINPTSPMWMGFADQHVNGAGPAQIVTFVGNSSARLTTAQPGDYFDNGSIQHLSHVIQDLAEFYLKEPEDENGEPEDFAERLQYMFHSFNAEGKPGLLHPQDEDDPFTNGGGVGARGATAEQQQSAYLPNIFYGANAQLTNYDPEALEKGIKQLRIGHLTGLHRSSRAPDGTPMHIRMDGPGFDAMDVPDGSSQPKLQFTAFVPTAEFFRVMRNNAASLDLVAKEDGGTEENVPEGVLPAELADDGLERFLTATRRQNFLVPPRRHRAFPLLELV